MVLQDYSSIACVIIVTYDSRSVVIGQSLKSSVAVNFFNDIWQFIISNDPLKGVTQTTPSSKFPVYI